jgi:hypothetical protein
MKHFATRSQASFFCEDADRFDVTISPPAEPINDYVAKRRAVSSSCSVWSPIELANDYPMSPVYASPPSALSCGL